MQSGKQRGPFCEEWEFSSAEDLGSVENVQGLNGAAEQRGREAFQAENHLKPLSPSHSLVHTRTSLLSLRIF